MAPPDARIDGPRRVSPRLGMRSGDRALGLWVCSRLRFLGRFALLLALFLTRLLLVSRLGLGACGQRQQAGYHYRLKLFSYSVGWICAWFHSHFLSNSFVTMTYVTVSLR